MSNDQDAKPTMREELQATWFATALILGVIGAQFSSRDLVDKGVRQRVDILFLSVALFIILWSTASSQGFLSKRWHNVGLVIVVVGTLASLIYVVYLSGTMDV